MSARRIDGALLDLRTAASLLGISERSLRWHAERQLVPHRRLGRRIIFRRSELENFYDRLPGVGLAEAKQNATRKDRR